MREDDGSECSSEHGLGAWSDDEHPLQPELLAVPPTATASRPSTAAALIHNTHDLPPACQAVLRRTASVIDASITAPPLSSNYAQQPLGSSLPERPRTRAQADESEFVSYVYNETAPADFYNPSITCTSQPDVLCLDTDNSSICLPATHHRSGSAANAPGGRAAGLARQPSAHLRPPASSTAAAAAGSDLSNLPTITFPLAAGLSSLSRRASSSATRRSSRLQDPIHGGTAAEEFPGTGGAAPAAASDLDVVRQLLLQRRPDMLEGFEAALEGNSKGDQE